jgi:putative membrane protein
MMSGTSMMAGMGWPGLLLMLLLWGGAIALILWGISSLFPAGRVNIEADALELLRQRYARGEISRAEFIQASADLHPRERAPLRHAHHHPGGRRP